MCYACRPTCENCRPKYISCPDCGYRNFLVAQTCVRCGRCFTNADIERTKKQWREAQAEVGDAKREEGVRKE